MDSKNTVVAIHAFDDNYIWLLHNGTQGLVVDPGDPAVVETALSELNIELIGILNTHHHFDHIGGIEALASTRPNLKIWGPSSQALVTEPCQQGDEIEPLPGLSFRVVDVPGHTLDHIAYYCDQVEQPILFCGDTLFAGGCGRMFEGNPEQMHASLERLASLSGNTLVYCAHEYTLGNLQFALAVEPDNLELQQRQLDAQSLRERDLATVPSELSLELATNPFMRCRQSSVQKAASRKTQNIVSNPVDTFAVLRKWKDNF